ncbi:MAG: hypothetical protein EOO38_29465, partial [Cytophagaceae bacterium]
MPETNLRQDDPEEQLPEPADIAEYAAYMQQESSSQSPESEDHLVGQNSSEPAEAVSAPAEATPAPSDAEIPPVNAENEPEIAISQPSDAEIASIDATLQPGDTESAPTENSQHPIDTDVLAEPATALPDANISTPDALPTSPEPSPQQKPESPADMTPVADITQQGPEVPPVHADRDTPEVKAEASEAESAEKEGFNFTFGRMPGDASPPEETILPINTGELLQSLVSRLDGRAWVYALDGQDAFRDYGDRIEMATPEASENDRMILAALLSAKANQRGAIEITGSEAFIQRTMTLIADYKIEVHLKNPQQREQFEALLKARAENTVPQNGLDIDPANPAVEPAPA